MSEQIIIHGDLGPDQDEKRASIDQQVYSLRQHLLLGDTINMSQAHKLYGIGHLPRRICDCIQYLKMDIQRDRWVKYTNERGKTTRLKEYYMLPEKIDEYILNSMHLEMPWVEIYAERKTARSNSS
jgi:hypothetical protein